MATALGTLCKKQHNHQETGQSLRYLKKDGSDGGCVECKRINSVNYPKEDPLKAKIRATNWRINNPERTRTNKEIWNQANRDKRTVYKAVRRAKQHQALTHNFTPDELITRFKRVFKCQCAYCQKALVYRQVEWDHLVAISKGGEQSLRNLIPSCLGCNRSKKDKPVFKWLKDSDRSIPYWLDALLTEDWFILSYAKQLDGISEDC